jgi:hypothetical protein
MAADEGLKVLPGGLKARRGDYERELMAEQKKNDG